MKYTHASTKNDENDFIIKRLICIEGIDGCGKDTQLKMLKDCGYMIGSEPRYDEPIGALIKKILKKEISLKNSASFEYLLAADRNEHITEILKYLKDEKSALVEKFFYITGRYKYSGLVYTDDLLVTERLNSAFPEAGLIIYLDINPEIAIKRIDNRGESKELYESIGKLTETNSRFKTLFDEYRNPKFGFDKDFKIPLIKFVDATKTPEEIHSEIKEIIHDYYLKCVI